MITKFKLYEKHKTNKYHLNDFVIVNNTKLNNRLVIISEISIKYDDIYYLVWNADSEMDDEQFTIKEGDIVKKMPSYKDGDYLIIKDYHTHTPTPMICNGDICDWFIGMRSFKDKEWITEPYSNIIRKMNKKDLETYKDIIERYEIENRKEKYNI